MICPRCSRPLPDWLLRERHTTSICPNCQSALDVYCFPALYQVDGKVELDDGALGKGENSCYVHTTRVARALCSHCGRFLCALCQLELGRDIFCPDCFSSPKAAVNRNSLHTQRTKFDSIALALATWPLLLFYFTVISAPLALIMAIYAWNKPTSIVRRSRWRIYLAIAMSSLEIASIGAFIILVVSNLKDFR